MSAYQEEHTVDWAALAGELEQLAEIRSPWQEQAVEWLSGLVSSGQEARVLDVGSGPGVTACLFAGTMPTARVTAVDIQPALLDRAAARAARLGLENRVETLQADITDPSAAIPEGDLVWASSVVHHAGDQQTALARLAATLRPGGVLAVVESGLPERFLPRDTGVGRPGLQARLDVGMEDWFAERRAALPDTVRAIEDWPGMLATTGLRPVGSRTFLVDIPAPVPAPVRAHVRDMLQRQRDLLGDRIDGEDRHQLDALLDPAATHGVLQRPDVFLLAASTVHAAASARRY